SEPVALHNPRATMTQADYIESGATETDGTFSITNVPRTWIVVNAGAAAFVGRKRGAQPIKVDNKAYTDDPLPLGLTCAGVTFHLPYDAWAPAESSRERYGLSLFAILSPGLGVGVGPAVGWRGLGLNAGYAWIHVSTTPSGKHRGDAVDLGSAPQLVSGATESFFVGLTFALK
ncbi:MAG TPA: hypothetical protein VGU27_00205, partial [Candidatus Eisenbacteria bacterium]|nr:hypothetical protein [Candidatus Eisenbacteria bacterium]